MAGLEVLFASAAPAITCAQDALVCFLHWEVVTHGYYGLGAGDQVRLGAGPGRGARCQLRKPRPVPGAWPSFHVQAPGLLTPLGLWVWGVPYCPSPAPPQLGGRNTMGKPKDRNSPQHSLGAAPASIVRTGHSSPS